MNTDARERFEWATLAGGCFWCLEAAFDELRGVQEVQSGYTGGDVPNPGYEDVCSGDTGHAEAVRIRFDPAQISYSELLQVFFTIHDPTTPNRQGSDVGTQYRSAVFYHSAEQKAAAERTIERMQKAGLWSDPIVTEVVPAGDFYEAETYHRDYFQRNPSQPYCQIVIQPKLAKLRKHFLEKLRK